MKSIFAMFRWVKRQPLSGCLPELTLSGRGGKEPGSRSDQRVSVGLEPDEHDQGKSRHE